MSKHTSGPWMGKGLNGKYELSGWSASHDSAASTTMAPVFADGEVVALVVHADPTHWGSSDEIVDANARLIAAAPDLLEALQDLFGADMEHVLMGDGKDDQIEAIAKARAAVAKATGTPTQEPSHDD